MSQCNYMPTSTYETLFGRFTIVRRLRASAYARSFQALDGERENAPIFLKVAGPALIPGVDPEWDAIRDTRGAEDRVWEYSWDLLSSAVSCISRPSPCVSVSTRRTALSQLSVDFVSKHYDRPWDPNAIIVRQARGLEAVSRLAGWPRLVGHGVLDGPALRAWLATDWIACPDIRAWMRAESVSFERWWRLFLALVSHLSSLGQACGWIHGDLKADHVLVMAEEECALIDGVGETLEGTGPAVFFTRSYNPFGRRSDVPALALLWWYALRGSLHRSSVATYRLGLPLPMDGCVPAALEDADRIARWVATAVGGFVQDFPQMDDIRDGGNRCVVWWSVGRRSDNQLPRLPSFRDLLDAVAPALECIWDLARGQTVSHS